MSAISLNNSRFVTNKNQSIKILNVSALVRVRFLSLAAKNRGKLTRNVPRFIRLSNIHAPLKFKYPRGIYLYIDLSVKLSNHSAIYAFYLRHNFGRCNLNGHFVCPPLIRIGVRVMLTNSEKPEVKKWATSMIGRVGDENELDASKWDGTS